MKKKNEGIVAMLVVGVLLIAGSMTYWKVSETKRQEREKNFEQTQERVYEIRRKMQDLPPGGELELLSADLRKAETELVGMKD